MNWFAMVNKMVPRDFFYAQGLQSYDNSKGEKLKMLMKKIVFPSGEWTCGMRQRMVPLSAGTIYE